MRTVIDIFFDRRSEHYPAGCEYAWWHRAEAPTQGADL